MGFLVLGTLAYRGMMKQHAEAEARVQEDARKQIRATVWSATAWVLVILLALALLFKLFA
jgi:hypothetical protein